MNDERQMREMEPEDIGLPVCVDIGHEWHFEWAEPDVGFYGFKECKHCGKQAAIEPGEGEFEEYE